MWLVIEHQYNYSKYISNVLDSSSVAVSICNVNIVQKGKVDIFIYNCFYFCILEGKVLQILFLVVFSCFLVVVIVYTTYHAREKLFKSTFHSNDILPVYYKNQYCV